MIETPGIIERAKDTVNVIYSKMGRIEQCEAALKALDGADILIRHGNDDISDLHNALSDDQIAEVMLTIHTLVRGNIDDSAAELDRICGGGSVLAGEEAPEPGSEIVPDNSVAASDSGENAAEASAPVINETVSAETESESEPAKISKSSKSTLPPDEEEKLLRRLYVTEQRTVKQIAEEMGLTKSNVYDRIRKYGLRNEKYDADWKGFSSESNKRHSEK